MIFGFQTTLILDLYMHNMYAEIQDVTELH